MMMECVLKLAEDLLHKIILGPWNKSILLTFIQQWNLLSRLKRPFSGKSHTKYINHKNCPEFACQRKTEKWTRVNNRKILELMEDKMQPKV